MEGQPDSLRVELCEYRLPKSPGAKYTAENVYQLLDEAAVFYVNHTRGVMIKEGELHVSSIYEWYKEDFGGSNQSLIRHLSQYAKGELAEQLKDYNGPIKNGYDWSLNNPEVL